MILTANTADFSANNLGQVFLGYSDLTLSVLSKYTKSLTDPQKKALNTMLNKLTRDGILAKQKHFYLPILAGAVTESFTNIASPTLAKDITPSATYWALKSGGLYNAVPTNIAGANLDLTLASGLATNDLHILHFNTENYTSVTDAFGPYGNNVIVSGMYWRVATGVEPAINFKLLNQDINALLPSSSSVLLNIGYKNKLKGWSFLQNTVFKSYSPTESAAITLTTPYTIAPMTGVMNLGGYLNAYMLKTQGLISIGKGLTNAEIQLMAAAVNPFMTAMGVTVE
jgi:hypothetical protein